MIDRHVTGRAGVAAVHATAIPQDARILRTYTRSDLSDAYAIALPADAVRDPERLARFLFERPSPWVAALMRLRDTMVRGFGIKTAASMRAALGENHGTGGRIGIFRIYHRDESEIVLGEDDRHLDFRLSVLVQRNGRQESGGATLVVSSVVKCHNRLGCAYLALVAPFHRLIVPATLRRADRASWPREDSPQPAGV